MITISSISNKDDLRNIIIDKFSIYEDNFYSLNNYISHHIIQKNFSHLKTFAQNNPATSLTLDSYVSLISAELTELDKDKAYEFTQTFNDISEDDFPHYVFIGSKSILKNTIFADFYPSAFAHLFNYLTSSNKLKQIGSGQGSAFIFISSIFTHDYSDYNASQIDSLSSINNILSDFKSLQEDNSFLVSKLQDKDLQISSLLSKIQELEYKIYLSTQMTWR